MSDTRSDLEHRLTNHRPATEQVNAVLDGLTARFLDIGVHILDVVPESRERALALTKLEEMSMWAKAGVARNQSEVS